MKMRFITTAIILLTACASAPAPKPDRPPERYGGYHLVAYSFSPTNSAKEFIVLFVGIGAKYVTVYYAPATDSWYAASKYNNFIEARNDYLSRIKRGVPEP